MTYRQGFTTTIRLTMPLVVLAGGALGIAGCSSDSGAAAPPCDEAAIQSALDAGLEDSWGSVFAIDDIACADGWAVAFPTVGESEEFAITITTVFRAEDQSWDLVDRSEDGVCGAYDPKEDPTNPVYPSDAAVPESLWQQACQTN